MTDQPTGEIRIEVFDNPPSGGFGLRLLNDGTNPFSLSRTREVLLATLGLVDAQAAHGDLDVLSATHQANGAMATDALVDSIEASDGLPVPTPRGFARRIEEQLRSRGYVVVHIDSVVPGALKEST